MKAFLIILTAAAGLTACGAGRGNTGDKADSMEVSADTAVTVSFDADSAYSYVKKQVEFGPRVPNSDAHRLAGDWMVAELKRHGASVVEQRADIKAFDGTILHARNIFGQYNPEETDRTLLLAHYDCRPWADEDPDPAKHKTPVDGANDGASGVGVLLEIARQISIDNPGKGIDILFVDAEDWGSEGNDDSWALGARHFVKNPVIKGYRPSRVIVADMVGGRGASFPVEYFSQQSAPDLVNEIWSAARSAGYGQLFPMQLGGAVTDDHVEFIKEGIPAVDIIEYHTQQGFNPNWHTSSDNLANIDKNTLGAVGTTIMTYLRK